MTSSDRHASHDSPYRTGQHMPLNQSRHAPLTSIATSANNSRIDINSPITDDHPPGSSSGLPNGNSAWPGTPGAGLIQSPMSPYSPGMRSNLALQRRQSGENTFENITPGEIQMQSFQEGLPPPPPVSHSWKRIDQWAQDNYEELYDQLGEGCTQNDVNELEHEIDCSLPLEVRESLQIHDGQERGGLPTGIIFGCMLLDCEEIFQEWKNWRVVNEEYLINPKHRPNQNSGKNFTGASYSAQSSSQASSNNPLWRQELLDRQDSQPSRAIQRVYAHPGWIPLARDWGGNNIAVDLAPGPVGKWGQIIIFGRDYDCKYVVARSWAAFLAMVADDISSEKVYVDEETQELKLREFKAASVEPAYLDILRWRMDQKYGRKAPRRRPGNPNTHGHPGSNPGSSRGSPYGSPTEDRGRSPIRYPNRGQTSSPRGGVGKPSPLAQVSQDSSASNPVHSKSMLAMEIPLPRPDEKLVEVETPVVSNEDPKKQDFSSALPATIPAAVFIDGRSKENQGKAVVTGLGVDGVGELKSVEI